MDIKWKNRVIPIVLRVLASYLFALSLLTAIHGTHVPHYQPVEITIMISISVALLALGITAYIYRRRYPLAVNSKYNRWMAAWFRKVTLDARVVIMLVLILFMYPMGEVVLDEISWSGMLQQFFLLSYYTVWITVFLLHVRNLITLLRNSTNLSLEWERIWFVYGRKFLQKFIRQATPATMRAGVIPLLVFVFLIVILFINSFNLPAVNLIAVLFLLVYAVIIIPRVLKGVIHFREMAVGVEQMAVGNLNVDIPLYGRGQITDIAVHLNQLNEGFQKAIEEQVASERMRSELITNVSHDLRTPLTSIVTYVDLLKREEATPEERARYVEVLSLKTERLTMLVDDLFEAAKMASGTVKFEIVQVDVVALMNQALAEFSDRIDTSGLIFRINSTEPHGYAKLDGKRTWRVFENLISNILKYALPNSRVYIDLMQDSEYVVLVLKNISEQEMNFTAEEIFERFKRGDLARTTEGSGLGLAIAKNIMELQGGEVKIDIDGDLFKVTVLFPK